jgi:hypothetical protein
MALEIAAVESLRARILRIMLLVCLICLRFGN